MSGQPSKLDELLAHRHPNLAFLEGLKVHRDYYQEAADREPTREVTDSDLPAMPGSIRDFPPDPRLEGAKGGPRPMAVVILDIVHGLTGRRFIVYRDTVDALFAESQDLKKFPSWLMRNPEKLNERSFHINEMVAPPNDVGTWLAEIKDEGTYDALVLFWYSNRVSK
jgi:hypothetical protein